MHQLSYCADIRFMSFYIVNNKMCTDLILFSFDIYWVISSAWVVHILPGFTGIGTIIWIRWWMCGCLVSWLCYHLTRSICYPSVSEVALTDMVKLICNKPHQSTTKHKRILLGKYCLTQFYYWPLFDACFYWWCLNFNSHSTANPLALNKIETNLS